MQVPTRSAVVDDELDLVVTKLNDYYWVLTEAADAARTEYRAIRRVHARQADLHPAYRHWQLLERRRLALASRLGLNVDQS